MSTPSAAGRRSWGGPAFTVALAAFCLWYLGDAWTVSGKVANLILIAPAVAIGLVLCAVILYGELKPARSSGIVGQDDDEPQLVVPETALDWRSFALMGLLALFVVAMEPLGFDLSAALFTAASLVLLGDRRPAFVVIYAVAFAALSIWLMRVSLTYGIPTALI
jgi:hypothetical protein